MKPNLRRPRPLVVLAMFLLWELVCAGFDIPEFRRRMPSGGRWGAAV